MKLDDLTRLLRPFSVRLANMIGRATVTSVDDARQVQDLQVELLEGEVRDEVERFGEYGFTSVPPKDSEAVVIFVGGRRDHGLAIGVEDRRYRLKNLQPGEVGVYDMTGTRIVLKANGDLEIVPSSGKAKLTGDLEITGTLTAAGDVVAGAVSLKSHTHSAGSLTSSPSGGAVTGVTGTP